MATTAKIVTPKGEFEWVVIDGDGKENLSGTMQYVANLVLDPSIQEHQDFLDKIDAFWADNRPDGFKGDPKSLGYYDHKVKADEPDENGDAVYEPTGKVYLSFKTGTTYQDGKQKKIQIFNSKAQPTHLGSKKIGNGSIGQISGAMGIYQTTNKNGKVLTAGVTLYLNSIKLSKLIEFNADSGFDADEDSDGWTGDDAWEGDDNGTVDAVTDGDNKPRL